MFVYPVALCVLANISVFNCNAFHMCTELSLSADSVGDPNAFVENADGCMTHQLASLFAV